MSQERNIDFAVLWLDQTISPTPLLLPKEGKEWETQAFGPTFLGGKRMKSTRTSLPYCQL